METKRTSNITKILTNLPKWFQDPSRIDLEILFGKSRLPDSSRHASMCWKHSPCHAFYTFPRVSPDSPRLAFWRTFGSLFGTLGAPKSPKYEKKAFRKQSEKMHCKRCSKTSKMTSKMGWGRWGLALFFASPDPSSLQMGPRRHSGSSLLRKLLLF